MLKQFGEGSVIVSFILQRVPHMRPQVTITRIEHEDPRMVSWVMTMPHVGGEGPKVSYGSGFFHWLRNQLLMVEDYAYEGHICVMTQSLSYLREKYGMT